MQGRREKANIGIGEREEKWSRWNLDDEVSEVLGMLKEWDQDTSSREVGRKEERVYMDANKHVFLEETK